MGSHLLLQLSDRRALERGVRRIRLIIDESSQLLVFGLKIGNYLLVGLLFLGKLILAKLPFPF